MLKSLYYAGKMGWLVIDVDSHTFNRFAPMRFRYQELYRCEWM